MNTPPTPSSPRHPVRKLASKTSKPQNVVPRLKTRTIDSGQSGATRTSSGYTRIQLNPKTIQRRDIYLAQHGPKKPVSGNVKAPAAVKVKLDEMQRLQGLPRAEAMVDFGRNVILLNDGKELDDASVKLITDLLFTWIQDSSWEVRVDATWMADLLFTQGYLDEGTSDALKNKLGSYMINYRETNTQAKENAQKLLGFLEREIPRAPDFQPTPQRDEREKERMQAILDQNERLQNELQRQQQDVEKLRQAAQERETEAQQVIQENVDMKKRLHEQGQSIAKEQVANEGLQKELQIKSKKLAEANKAVEEQEALAGEWEKQVHSANEKSKLVQEQAASMQKQLQDSTQSKEKELAQAKAQNTQQATELEQIQKELKDQKEKFQKKEAEFEKQRLELESKQKQSEEQAKSEIAKLKNEVQETKQRLTEEKADKKRITDQTKELGNLKFEVKKLNKEVLKKDSENESLQTDVEDLEAEIARLKAKVTVQEGEFSTACDYALDLEASVNKNRELLKASEQANQKLMTLYEELSKKLDKAQLLQEADEFHFEKIRSQGTEIELLKDENAKIQRYRGEAEQELKQEKAKTQQLQKDLKNISAEKDKEKKEHDSLKQKYRQQGVLQKHAKQTSEEFEALKVTTKELREKESANELELETLRAENAKLKQKALISDEENPVIINLQKTLAEQKKASETNLNDKEKELKAEVKKNNELQAANESLENRVSELSDANTVSEKERENLVELNDRQTVIINRLTSNINNKNTTNQQLTDQSQLQKDQIEILIAENDSLKSQQELTAGAKSNLEAENLNIKQDLEKIRKQISDNEKKLVEQLDQNASLNSKFLKLEKSSSSNETTIAALQKENERLKAEAAEREKQLKLQAQEIERLKNLLQAKPFEVSKPRPIASIRRIQKERELDISLRQLVERVTYTSSTISDQFFIDSGYEGTGLVRQAKKDWDTLKKLSYDLYKALIPVSGETHLESFLDQIKAYKDSFSRLAIPKEQNKGAHDVLWKLNHQITELYNDLTARVAAEKKGASGPSDDWKLKGK